MCSSICKCIGCKNFEESPERKTLMHLADAAEVRVQQQTAAKTKLSSQISDLLMRTTPVISSGGGRYGNTSLLQQQEVTGALGGLMSGVESILILYSRIAPKSRTLVLNIQETPRKLCLHLIVVAECLQ